MKFKPLTIGRLPRVLLFMVAMPFEDRSVLCEEMRPILRSFPIDKAETLGVDSMAEVFAGILFLPKGDRRELAATLDRMLDELLRDDFFGTDGQNDPRGDHRD